VTAINVLLVDDISSTLENLRKLLSFEEDIDVVATATNGREAVDAAKQLGPQVVLMDVNMPEMDGIQATEILAAEAPHSPVIIMSVQGERDYLRRAMQSGAREFLIKPFSGDELVASIRRVHQLEERKEVYVRVPVPGGPADQTAAPGGDHARRSSNGAAKSQAEVQVLPAEAPVVPEVSAEETADGEGRFAAPAPTEAEPGAAPGAVDEPAPPETPEAEEVAPEPSVPAVTDEAAGAADTSNVAVGAPTDESATAEVAAPDETTAAMTAEVAVAPPQSPGEAALPLPRTTNGGIIVLYGGKGGVGKSVIATNLACALAKETSARVGLVDLDLQFGDIGVLLNMSQTQSITDLVENIDQVDNEFLYDSMADGPGGIRVLPTAPSPELADLVTPAHVHKILEESRRAFDFVVVDTSSHMGDITLAALDVASRILLVTALSIPAVKNAKLALRLFETLSIPPESITLVLNRCEAHTEFNKESIESHLKFPIAVQIPHDPRTIVNSINRGNPFVLASPETEASQRVRQLVSLLLPDKVSGSTAAAPPRRGLRFGRR
jgi:MinD-like ATPase involved in chromosome partitioning or flagellar assembly/DNA-binding NarL/FixJ family response regulator